MIDFLLGAGIGFIENEYVVCPACMEPPDDDDGENGEE